MRGNIGAKNILTDVYLTNGVLFLFNMVLSMPHIIQLVWYDDVLCEVIELLLVKEGCERQAVSAPFKHVLVKKGEEATLILEQVRCKLLETIEEHLVHLRVEHKAVSFFLKPEVRHVLLEKLLQIVALFPKLKFLN